ncbi:hypothetical protein O3M35_003493 [Rhynocoris fuscipes]|uniref:PDZ domain-containing protein n=1 Tax=Rhynocoris fuscipes TaxID=488301 RepID=A0AAW1CKK3_9HEMI
MGEIIRLERFDNTPWGFRLTGGYDFGTPLSVIKVTGGSIAALSGVKVGDIVIEINGQSTKHFIHKDAQNFIGISGNHLTLTVLRGSLITPDVTPLRGRTPAQDNEEKEYDYEELDEEELNDRLERRSNGIEDEDEEQEYDEYDEPIVHENTCMRSEFTSSKLQNRNQVEILNPNVSDTELDEVLTGNEEVLDEGVLGINFKKFLPQVDFIRESEVFKFLQNENTKKEIPEEEQLKKEPTKRFSTFLQKPKPPPPKPAGPLWHYPKAPRYLPRDPPKPPEEPRRRPKRDSCHTVLWLFLEETGDHVIDERWGSEEEERLNLSRCEMREDDTASLTSSGVGGRDSRLEKLEEISRKVQKSEQSENKTEESAESNVEHIEGILVTEQHESETKLADSEIKEEEIRENEESVENQSCKVLSSEETMMKEETDENEEIESSKTEKKQVFTKQLADIQAQIAALEIQAPSDLQTQLLAIQEQLSKIVSVKSVQVTSSKGGGRKEQMEQREYYTDERTRTEEEERLVEESEEGYCEYTFECEARINGDDDSSDKKEDGDKSDSESSIDDSERIAYDSDGSAKDETESSNYIEGFQKGEYEICEAPEPRKTKKFHPITPQMRPIVLPGGRMWRQPKDACHDDFYQGVLVAQAEVMVGNKGGVHFTKYVPPKFDITNSAVCRLVHEIEDKTRQQEFEKENLYHTPIGKRHFYAASLKEPEPIGGIDL